MGRRTSRVKVTLALCVLLAMAPISMWVVRESNPACVVESVSDGDTITVRGGGDRTRVRVYGIDCPEAGQAYGGEAGEFTRTLTLGKRVILERKSKDQYGRTVATVTLPDGRDLAHELVRHGLAWWYERYAPDDEALKTLEAEARAKKLGLWSQARPTPPWDYRKAKHKGRTAQTRRIR
jgi:endonuclease YncB( thermonuclease family)